jgi:hypothetical protein
MLYTEELLPLSHNYCTLYCVFFFHEPLLLHYSLLLVDYLYMKLSLLLLYTSHSHYCTLVVHYYPTPLPLLYACHATAKDTISTLLTVCTARITDTFCFLHICKLEPKYRRYTHCSCAAAAATSTCCCTKKLHAHTGVHCTLLHSLLVTLVYSHCAPVVVPYRARTHAATSFPLASYLSFMQYALVCYYACLSVVHSALHSAIAAALTTANTTCHHVVCSACFALAAVIVVVAAAVSALLLLLLSLHCITAVLTLGLTFVLMSLLASSQCCCCCCCCCCSCRFCRCASVASYSSILGCSLSSVLLLSSVHTLSSDCCLNKLVCSSVLVSMCRYG